jgi:hypothetical protein
MEITDLCWERPLAWGFFRRDAYIDANWDCQKLWVDSLLDGNNPRPVYFATALGKADEAKIPEILRAQLISLSVLDKENKEIGSYHLDKAENVSK